MSKYGLQLRVKNPPQKQAARPPPPKVLGFGDDDDDDNVERDILRQAYKNKTHKDVSLLLLYIRVWLLTKICVLFSLYF